MKTIASEISPAALRRCTVRSYDSHRQLDDSRPFCRKADDFHVLCACGCSAKIIAITDKAVTVRQNDDVDSRLFISQLQLGKYTIRPVV
jgi:hypothetical protein